jgi:hypothetical protein
MIQKHLYASDEKLKWWGYGEWVQEPDNIIFDHEGFKCHCLRIVRMNNYDAFGGHWCGYIYLPEHHPWYDLNLHNIEASVHGGLSYSQMQRNATYAVGFDCGHSFDLVPSLEKYLKEDKVYDQMKHNTCSKLFSRHYRNVNYIVNQTQSLANQASEIKKTLAK